MNTARLGRLQEISDPYMSRLCHTLKTMQSSYKIIMISKCQNKVRKSDQRVMSMGELEKENYEAPD